ncbi:MAG: type II secretion system protein [Bacteriovoracia bacterium]
MSLSSKNQNGFSLIEMMLVLGLISGAAYLSSTLVVQGARSNRGTQLSSEWVSIQNSVETAVMNQRVCSSLIANNPDGDPGWQTWTSGYDKKWNRLAVGISPNISVLADSTLPSSSIRVNEIRVRETNFVENFTCGAGGNCRRYLGRITINAEKMGRTPADAGYGSRQLSRTFSNIYFETDPAGRIVACYGSGNDAGMQCSAMGGELVPDPTTGLLRCVGDSMLLTDTPGTDIPLHKGVGRDIDSPATSSLWTKGRWIQGTAPARAELNAVTQAANNSDWNLRGFRGLNLQWQTNTAAFGMIEETGAIKRPALIFGGDANGFSLMHKARGAAPRAVAEFLPPGVGPAEPGAFGISGLFKFGTRVPSTAGGTDYMGEAYAGFGKDPSGNNQLELGVWSSPTVGNSPKRVAFVNRALGAHLDVRAKEYRSIGPNSLPGKNNGFAIFHADPEQPGAYANANWVARLSETINSAAPGDEGAGRLELRNCTLAGSCSGGNGGQVLAAMDGRGRIILSQATSTGAQTAFRLDAADMGTPAPNKVLAAVSANGQAKWAAPRMEVFLSQRVVLPAQLGAGLEPTGFEAMRSDMCPSGDIDALGNCGDKSGGDYERVEGWAGGTQPTGNSCFSPSGTPERCRPIPNSSDGTPYDWCDIKFYNESRFGNSGSASDAEQLKGGLCHIAPILDATGKITEWRYHVARKRNMGIRCEFKCFKLKFTE